MMLVIYRFAAFRKQNKLAPRAPEWPILTMAVLFAQVYDVAQSWRVVLKKLRTLLETQGENTG